MPTNNAFTISWNSETNGEIKIIKCSTYSTVFEQNDDTSFSVSVNNHWTESSNLTPLPEVPAVEMADCMNINIQCSVFSPLVHNSYQGLYFLCMQMNGDSQEIVMLLETKFQVQNVITWISASQENCSIKH